MKTLLATGLILLLWSIYMIVQMTREASDQEMLDRRFQADGAYFNLTPHWKGHTISLTDDALPSDPSAKVIQPWGHKERPGRVRITIDGKDFSWPHDVMIRPESNGELNRYHHGIFMGPLLDKEKRAEQFLIVQRCVENGKDQYRVLRLLESGEVEEEIFSHSQRTTPLEHMFFVSLVYPDLIAIHSNVFLGPLFLFWPLFFAHPFVYSAGIGLVGTALIATALWRITKARKSN